MSPQNSYLSLIAQIIYFVTPAENSKVMVRVGFMCPLLFTQYASLPPPTNCSPPRCLLPIVLLSRLLASLPSLPAAVLCLPLSAPRGARTSSRTGTLKYSKTEAKRNWSPRVPFPPNGTAAVGGADGAQRSCPLGRQLVMRTIKTTRSILRSRDERGRS